MNDLFISAHNPIHFYLDETNQPAQYNTKHYGDYQYRETIREWETKAKYFQKWQNNDVIYLQFLSDFSPLQIDIIDKYGNSQGSFVGLQKLQDETQPGKYAYEFAIGLGSLPEGCYYLALDGGSGTLKMFSEPFQVKQLHPNTLLFEYRDSGTRGDVLYGTGITFGFRVEGNIRRPVAGADTQSYINQKGDPKVLSSHTFKTFPIMIGGSRGVPDWALDLINEIFSCDFVRIDGKQFAKEGDVKFELVEENNYSLIGFSFDVREGINRPGKYVNPTLNTNVKVSIVHHISSRVFGDTKVNGSGNLISIYSLE